MSNRRGHDNSARSLYTTNFQTMYLGSVDYPESLLTALEQDRLVIFAGAGVSMSPPSCEPSFRHLAEKVAKGTGHDLERSDVDQLDHFLGRLPANVHRRTKRILETPDAESNTLHRDLLRIFRRPERVRLVTTNFDLHFERAWRELFSEEPSSVYRGPSLPPGHDFRGLVHLHGALDQSPDQMILTDEDFGRAYLTEGWARRFVLDLFQTHTVLFVGFSHDDTILKYLARGLPSAPEPKRFALVPNSDHFDSRKWELLDTTPLRYPLEDNNHVALRDSVEAWANHRHRTPLEINEEIKSKVEGGPPSSVEASSKLVRSLQDHFGATFFTKHAEGVEWLEWLEQQDLLTPIFESNDLTRAQHQLGVWLVREFAIEHPERFWLTLESYGGDIPYQLRYKIVVELARSESPPPPGVLNRWVPVLLGNWSPNEGIPHELYELISVSLDVEAEDAVLMLFGFLTEPVVTLRSKQRIFGGEKELEREPEVKVGSRAGPQLEEKDYRRVIELGHQRDPQRLWNVLVANLQRALATGKAWEKLRPDYDRSAVHEHEQDSPPFTSADHIDVLVDSLRELLDKRIEADEEHVTQWIGQLASSEDTLLRRIAIHGLCKLQHVDADYKLQWLFEKDEWLFESQLRAEVFHLLEETYDKLSAEYRRKLLECIEAYENEELSEVAVAHKQLEFFEALRRAEPDCQQLADRLETLRSNHPDLEVSEYPELTSWRTSYDGGRPEPAIETEALLELDPAREFDTILERLDAGEANKWGEEPRNERVLEKVVERHIEWGLTFTESFDLQERESPRLVRALFRGWRNADLDEAQWSQLLAILNDHDVLLAHPKVVPPLLAEATESESFPDDAIEAAFSVAQTLWRHLESSDASDHSSFHAPSPPGDQLTRFVIEVLVRLQERDSFSVEPEYDALLEFLENMLQGAHPQHLAAQCMVARHILTLRDVLDDWRIWVDTHLLPCLDGQHGNAILPVWEGVSSLDRLDDSLAKTLRPAFDSLFPNLAELPSRVHRRLFDQIARTSIVTSSAPLDNWIWPLFRNINDELRGRFVRQLHGVVKTMEPSRQRDVWEEWLQTFWEYRTDEAPVEFGPEEKKNLLKEAFELPVLFQDLANLIQDWHGTIETQGLRLRSLLDRHEVLLEKHPNQVVQVLTTVTRLVNDIPTGGMCYNYVQSARALREYDVDPELMTTYCHRVAEQGCPGIVDVLRDLDGTRSSIEDG